MKRVSKIAGVLGTLAASQAFAVPLTVPPIQVSTTNTIRYVCHGGKVLSVHYMNTKNAQSFALLSVAGRRLLFVNVLSGSGAKYVADHYTWWTKGPQGTLSDDTADPNAPPLLADCKAGG
jgi:membrane-bound inhibitor of C-type lysozyme